jgi:glycosyltransferase involved in cell wall biosynthesis
VRVAVIPALDEAGNIGSVVDGIGRYVDKVVVVDNGSRDSTADVAREHGAIVEHEPRRGYGAACHRGLARARALDASVVMILDGDGSDDPADAPRLLAEIEAGAELALGIRTRETTEPGAMTSVQRFGNWFAPAIMRVAFGAPYHDMPPFKAIQRDALDRLQLTDMGHGFPIELLLQAHRRGLRIVEIPVRCRVRRSGESKVSGTVGGAARAAVKILATIARYSVRPPPTRGKSPSRR